MRTPRSFKFVISSWSFVLARTHCALFCSYRVLPLFNNMHPLRIVISESFGTIFSNMFIDLGPCCLSLVCIEQLVCFHEFVHQCIFKLDQTHCQFLCSLIKGMFSFVCSGLGLCVQLFEDFHGFVICSFFAFPFVMRGSMVSTFQFRFVCRHVRAWHFLTASMCCRFENSPYVVSTLLSFEHQI